MNRYKKYEPIFGEWTINSLIGEGSFGRVYEIERKDFGRTYKAALKAITIPESESEIKSAMSEGMDEVSVSDYFMSCVEQVVDEFALMSKLKGNSHIVSYENHKVIPHVGKIGWDILIQMELLTPINEYFNKHIVTQKDVIKLGIDLCQALEVCHKYNIIHRDIKPENIFISEIGDYKLGDFGIARTIEKTTSGLSKKGTYGYMAPEVYRGEAYGSSVDLYSLGLVLYRLLNNNRLPFLPPYPQPIKFSDKDSAFVQRMNGVEIPKPSNASDELVAIVLKATSYKAGDRYASAEEMRKDLENLLIKEEKSNAPNTTESVDADIETHEEGTVLLFDSNKSHSLIKKNVARIEYKTELIYDNDLLSQDNLVTANEIRQPRQYEQVSASSSNLVNSLPAVNKIEDTEEEESIDEAQNIATTKNKVTLRNTDGNKKDEITNEEENSNQKMKASKTEGKSSKKFYAICGGILGTLFLLILLSYADNAGSSTMDNTSKDLEIMEDYVNSVPEANEVNTAKEINSEQNDSPKKTGELKLDEGKNASENEVVHDSKKAEELYQAGKKYDNGDGVTQDSKKAVELFEQAAELGNADACYELGFYYELQWIDLSLIYALTGDEDTYTTMIQCGDKAAMYYTKGAELGHMVCMRALGNAYKEGNWGFTQNNAKADEWYKKAEEAEKSN